eukprot:CAMPEP_0198370484 /NCGR_PEP_ID=MMETSP1450-20131203/156740_1 /TAXON_ID=753684 ORGANISM="Madagascaria erythrocladiodes, Strain CCMP3234" /NCGR_SAMPLE_ID=MMETSP1450 /ASSEMBLY_ACC=CAM_ASM_001115 /LENGTH=359 /DNA_ID=CAMNT_0044078025 /DNA_START=85 /DNA_END=1164 /DNA_ORIENTATION=+
MSSLSVIVAAAVALALFSAERADAAVPTALSRVVENKCADDARQVCTEEDQELNKISCGEVIKDLQPMNEQCCEGLKKFYECFKETDKIDGPMCSEEDRKQIESVADLDCSSVAPGESPAPGESESPEPGETPEPTEGPGGDDDDDDEAGDDDDDEAGDDDDDGAAGDDDGEEDDGVCFPARATVQLGNGYTKTMAELQIGDCVRTAAGHCSEVYFFSHRVKHVSATFVTLSMVGADNSSHTVSLTPNHYLVTATGLKAARTVSVGDALTLGDSQAATVTAVQREVLTGLYNPHTISGSIVVDGVSASCYTTTVHPVVAQVLLAPLRLAYTYLGLRSPRFLDMPSSALSARVPSGPASF